MLAVVKTPRIDLRIKGRVPPRLLRCLRSEFGNSLEIREDEKESVVDFFETDIYNEIKSTMTPGAYVRIYRENKDLTQQQLGELLQVSKAFVCDIEKDRRQISKQMAKNLSKIFGVSVSRFI